VKKATVRVGGNLRNRKKNYMVFVLVPSFCRWVVFACVYLVGFGFFFLFGGGLCCLAGVFVGLVFGFVFMAIVYVWVFVWFFCLVWVCSLCCSFCCLVFLFLGDWYLFFFWLLLLFCFLDFGLGYCFVGIFLFCGKKKKTQSPPLIRKTNQNKKKPKNTQQNQIKKKKTSSHSSTTKKK